MSRRVRDSRGETFCPWCGVDTTTPAFVHPELGIRYCSIEHARQHVGVAEYYRVQPVWARELDFDDHASVAVWRAENVPAEWAGRCTPAAAAPWQVTA